MDIGTGLALFGCKDLAVKLLGPTADYLGGELQGYVKQRVENTKKIFESAGRWLGPKIEEPGCVPPRVLKTILDEGSFCEDPLVTEYFGGVLASSRSPMGRDDRGIYWANIVSRLSSYQLRVHYLVYHSIYNLFKGEDVVFNGEDRQKLSIFWGYGSYLISMQYSLEETSFLEANYAHIFFSLHKEGLLEGFYYGDSDSLSNIYSDEFRFGDENGVVLTPSVPGIELFLWAHGQGNVAYVDFLKLDFPEIEDIKPCKDVVALEDLRVKRS